MVMEAGVFGSGLPGRPEVPTIVVLPLAPLPSAVHVLETTPMLMVPTVTSRALASLVANPR